jgi:biopolymer transport protein ExbB
MLDSFVQIMEKGGVIMYPILLLSIISLGIFFERLYTLRREKFLPEHFLSKLNEALAKKDFDAARAISSASNSPIANISTDILKNLDLPISRLIESTEETGRYESRSLERYQHSLQTIATISPLLGLLGTVSGMIKMFVFISGENAGTAQSLATGISEALLTTAAGLSVAIPTMIFYYIIRYRADTVGMQLEKATSNILNLILKEGRS